MLARRLHRALNPSGRRCLHPAPLAAPVSPPNHHSHHRRAALQHRRLSSGPDMSVSPAAATRPARRHTASAGRTRSAAPLAGVQRGPGQDAGGALHPRRRRRQRGRAGHQEERAPDGRALDAPGRHPAPRLLRLPLQPAERYAPAPHPRRNAPARSFSPARDSAGRVALQSCCCRSARPRRSSSRCTGPTPAAPTPSTTAPPSSTPSSTARWTDRSAPSAPHDERSSKSSVSRRRRCARAGCPAGSFSGARWLRERGGVRVGRSCRRSVSRS